MKVWTEFAPWSVSWFKAGVLGLACLAAAAGQGVTLDSGPVLTESVSNPFSPSSGGNCPLTAPPAASAFHATDPIMTVWIGLLGLTPQDSVQFRFSYNGTPEPTLEWDYAAGAFQSGYNYILCPSLGTSSVLGLWGQAFASLFPGGGGAGSWTLGIYIDGSSSPISTIPFTILSGGGTANPAITSVTTAYAGPVIAQNTFIVVKGTNLVPANTPAGGAIWSSAPSFASGQMPTQLGGVSVTVDNKPAFVYFYCSAATDPACSQDQLNLLTPLDNTTGSVPVVVTSGAVSSPPFTANMQAVAPSFLLFNTAGYVAATHANGTLLGPTSLFPGSSTPASPGEPIVLYAVGFGLPASPVVNGSAVQSGALPVMPVCQVAGTPAALAFAGLISPGLCQLNLTIPASAANGDNIIRCTYNGSTTPAADLIAVQSNTPNRTLSITTTGAGSGTVGSSPAGTSCGSGCLTYAAGTVVTLTETPNIGSTFAGWSGACAGTGSCIVTMNSNQSVTATFNLAATGPVPATIMVTPASIALLAGQQTQFTATAFDAAGNPMSGVTFAWVSSSSSVASVSSSGLAGTEAIGSTNITASAGGVASNLVPLMVVSAGVQFTDATNISTTMVAAAPNGTFDLVWAPPASGLGVLFTTSADGVAFSSENLLPSSDSGGQPAVAVGPNGNIFAAWGSESFAQSNGLTLFGNVALATSADGGHTFSSPVNATNRVQNIFGNGASVFADPKIAIDQSGNVNLVTTLSRSLSDALFDILYSRSANGGATFSGPTAVFSARSSGSAVYAPVVAASGANVYVAWALLPSSSAPETVMFMRSTDGGNTFQTPLTLGQLGGGCAINCAGIGVDGNGVITVVWSNAGVFFARSTNNGASFSAPAKIATTGFADSTPVLAVDSRGTLHVVFTRIPPQAPGIQTDIYFTRSTDGGNTWSVPVNVSFTFNETSSAPWIAVDGNGNIDIAWMEQPTPGNFSSLNVYYRRAR